MHVLQQLLEGGGLVPENHLAAGIACEEIVAAQVVEGAGLVEGDDEGVEIRHLDELVEDGGEGRTVHLGRNHRDHERHGKAPGEGEDLGLQVLEGPGHEARQSGDGSDLVEVAHRTSSSGDEPGQRKGPPCQRGCGARWGAARSRENARNLEPKAGRGSGSREK